MAANVSAVRRPRAGLLPPPRPTRAFGLLSSAPHQFAVRRLQSMPACCARSELPRPVCGQVRDAIRADHPLPQMMRERKARPGEVSDDSDDEFELDEAPLVPFEKAIVGFFFAGFFMCVLMLVGLTKVSLLAFRVAGVPASLLCRPRPHSRPLSLSHTPGVRSCYHLQLAKLVFLVVSIFAIGVAAFTDSVPSAPGMTKLNED